MLYTCPTRSAQYSRVHCFTWVKRGIFILLLSVISQASVSFAQDEILFLDPEVDDYIRIAKQLGSKRDRKSLRVMRNKAVSPLKKIAERSTENENYGQAIYIYKNLYEIYKNIYGEFHFKASIFLNRLAYTYQLAEKYPEQIAILEKQLKHAEAKFGPNHLQTLKIMENLAFAYKQNKAHALSEQLYKRIINAYKTNGWTENAKYKSLINRFSSLYVEQGELHKAEPYYEEQLGIQPGEKVEVTGANMTKLFSYAVILQYSGKYAEAEELYKNMLRESNDRGFYGETSKEQIYASLGALYNQIGAYEKALEYKKLAFDGYKSKFGGSSVITAYALNNLAETYLALKQYDKALNSLIIVSLILESQIKEKNKIFIDKNFAMPNLALAYSKVGKYEKAEEIYNKTLSEISRDYSPNHPLVTYSKSNLAEIYYLQNRLDEAADITQEALTRAINSKSPLLLARTYFVLAKIRYKQSYLSEAIFYGKQGVNELQNLRAGLVNTDKSLQESFVDSQQENYEILAGWLIDAGRLTEAEQVLAMLKEEEYFNFIRRTQSSNPRSTQAQLNVLELRYKTNLQQSSALLFKYATKLYDLEKTNSDTRSASDRDEIAKLRRLLVIAEESFDRTLTEIRTAFREYNATESSATIESEGYQSLLKKLGEDVALVHLLSLDESLRIILRTHRMNVAKKTVVTRTLFNKEIHEYLKLLKRPDQSVGELRKISEKLYQWLIKPIETELNQAGIKTVMFYKNGTLRYVPLATLYDGKHYFVEKYAISNYTAAAKAAFNSESNSKWKVAGMGVSKQHGDFSPLKMVPYELENIVKHGSSDPNGIFQGDVYVDEAFTAKRLKASLSDIFNVSHIATHYKFMPGTEADSFLLMGDGSHLSLATLRTAGYDFKAIDLLTLSACETAINDVGSDGREVEGLATLVQRQGAKGVMATLWPVSDCSTGIFMQHFYSNRRQGMSKAEALRKSQLAFITTAAPALTSLRNSSGNGCQSAANADKNVYRHPYYWAPFILMGNWK